jgi:hypothetical protein
MCPARMLSASVSTCTRLPKAQGTQRRGKNLMLWDHAVRPFLPAHDENFSRIWLGSRDVGAVERDATRSPFMHHDWHFTSTAFKGSYV